MKNFAFFDDLIRWQAELLNETAPPLIQSVSYGSQFGYPSNEYTSRADVEYMKIDLRGTSVIIASGDYGAGCGFFDNNNEAAQCTMQASYPAFSPYVTSVGATAFIRGASGPERAVYLFQSGGGFSPVHPVPSYQTAAVAEYLASGVVFPPNGFNSSNRMTPDVAALGDEHFMVIDGGNVVPVGGTSASTPTFSAVITLLNDVRLQNGKSSMGFLNPWIYSTWASTKSMGKGTAAFWDVEVGDNVCGGTKKAPCGFTCTTGPDAVTGLGTPNMKTLLKYI